MPSQIHRYLNVYPSNQLGQATKFRIPGISNLIDRFRKPKEEPKPKIFDEKVISSNLSRVVYFPDVKTLRIYFKSGGIYQYYSVPNTTYKGLIGATSKGKYFWRNIRDEYDFETLR